MEPFRQTLLRLPHTSRSSILHYLRLLPPKRRQASQTSAQHSSSATSDFIPPPSPTSGPLLVRAANRALPDLASLSSRRTWLLTLPIFVFVCTISSLGIFNYQKSSSSTVASILYALRINPTARDLLGDEIYFASKIPWISGELNQLHGIINLEFEVKGTKGRGRVKFVSYRTHGRGGRFETKEWSLKMDDGETVQLLEEGGTADPLAQ